MYKIILVKISLAYIVQGITAAGQFVERATPTFKI